MMQHSSETIRGFVQQTGGDEIKGCKAWLKSLPDTERSRLEDLARGVTFTRRRYGGKDWFTWAHHKDLELCHDPWPAVRWPHAVLVALVATREPKT